MDIHVPNNPDDYGLAEYGEIGFGLVFRDHVVHAWKEKPSQMEMLRQIHDHRLERKNGRA